MLGFLNFFVFQWFFVRLAYATRKIDGKERVMGYFWLKWPIPLTGWNLFGIRIRYRYIKKIECHRFYTTKWLTDFLTANYCKKGSFSKE